MPSFFFFGVCCFLATREGDAAAAGTKDTEQSSSKGKEDLATANEEYMEQGSEEWNKEEDGIIGYLEDHYEWSRRGWKC